MASRRGTGARRRFVGTGSRCAREALLGALACCLAFGLLERVRSALAAAAVRAEPAALAPDPAGAPPLASAPAQVASYALHARLDAPNHRIEGTEKLTFVNRSTRPLEALYFHLYLNAFKNDASVFLRSPFGEARGALRAEDWGYIDVTRCTAPAYGATNLWKSHTTGTPEEPEDETDVLLPLPAALEPGATLELDLDFTAKLPSVVLRTGYSDDFVFAGQWFPKLARLEPNGTFAHFPFHAQAEFYADFGDYDVELDVPAGFVVGATGRELSSAIHGERAVHHFRAESVHDFAWTAWPDFVRRTARIDAVDVTLLYPPGHAHNAEQTLGALRFALPRASALFGEYPYPTLTVVHPPERAAEAGGMEYPTLIATGGPWYLGLLGDRGMESVTIHELMHQWFYGLVATNEARSPFLDEGLTSYAELRLLDAAYGPGSAFDGFDVTISATSLAHVFSAARAGDLAVASPAAAFPSFRTLGALVYSRTATILETLARVYGRTRLDGALGTYARRYRFAHPSAEDFLTVMGSELGPVARRFLEQSLEDRGRVDFLVRDVQSVPERVTAGIFDRSSGRQTVAPEAAPGGHYRGRAVILRHGSLELPVDIDLYDAAGARTREHWDGQGPLHVIDWRGDAPLARVVIDPERRIVVDDDLLNNAVAVRPSFPARTLERATYLSELALAFLVP